MNELHKKGLKKGFIALGIWFIFTILVASLGNYDPSFTRILWFIDAIIFVIALALIIISLGAHSKEKLHRTK